MPFPPPCTIAAAMELYRRGAIREDDRLPKRLPDDPIVNGPSKGMVSRLPPALPQYYEARGWVNAFPTDETLKKLGLDECLGK